MIDNLKLAHKKVYEHAHTGNIVLDIKKYIKYNYDLKRNSVSRNLELDGEPINDTMLNSIFVSIRTEEKKATKDLVFSIIFSDFIPTYNPFFDFFEKHKQSKPVGNIDKLILSIDTDTKNYGLFIKKWLVAIIGSIHGYHSPLMLVLTGSQNTGKTHWFRYLLPPELLKYYAESQLDLAKDDEILMTKKLIIMDDEMGGKNKTESKKLKYITSKQTFSIRSPYGRVSEDLIRLAVLCGTSNDEELLNDPTGNRRLLPILVKGINREIYNSINKDELFYECYLLYKSGYLADLNNDEIGLLNDSTHNFKQASPEEELISKYYSHPSEGGYSVERTNSEILSYIQLASQLRLSQTKLGLVLKQMGFEQNHKKVNGTTIRIYKVVENNLSTSTNYNQPVTGKDDDIIQIDIDKVGF